MSLLVVIASQLSEHESLRELAVNFGEEAEVRLYDDPHELLSVVAVSPPDLLIASGHLPGMSAKELLDRFRTLPACSDVPAVVLVTYESDKWREVSFKSGITEFAVMPVDKEELTVRSKHLLTSRLEQKRKRKHDVDEGPVEFADNVASSLDERVRARALDGLIQTLSAKLLTKIAEIDRLRGELQNLVDATSVAAVFLDERACIRHFTPQIWGFYELSDRYIGKPLQNVPCKLGYSSLSADVQRVQTTGSPVERYIERHSSETYYLLRISPNRSRDEAIWGMTITFVQVSLPSLGRA